MKLICPNCQKRIDDDSSEVAAVHATYQIYLLMEGGGTLTEATKALCIAAYKIGHRYKNILDLFGNYDYRKIRKLITDPQLITGQISTLTQAFAFCLGLGRASILTADDAYDAFVESRKAMKEGREDFFQIHREPDFDMDGLPYPFDAEDVVFLKPFKPQGAAWAPKKTQRQTEEPAATGSSKGGSP